MFTLALSISLLNPAHALPELPLNGVDEDGDGSDGIRIAFQATFPTAAAPSGWTKSGSGAFFKDTATVSGLGHVKWTGAREFAHGDLYVGVDLNSLSGPCNLTVDWNPYPLPSAPSTRTVSLSAGTQVYRILGATGPLRVASIKLACLASGSMSADWVTIQNGAEVFPPPGDVDITWTDVDVPLGGYETHTTLRAAYTQNPVPTGLLASTDVGGVAVWVPTDERWEVRNGTWPYSRWQDQDLDTWDIAEAEGGEWITVTGVFNGGGEACDDDACSPGLLGQLLVSDDDGLTWVPEADSVQSVGAGTPAFAAARRVGYFQNDDGKAGAENAPNGKIFADTPGGRLIERAGSSVFLANHLDAGELQPGDPNVCDEPELPSYALCCAKTAPLARPLGCARSTIRWTPRSRSRARTGIRTTPSARRSPTTATRT